LAKKNVLQAGRRKCVCEPNWRSCSSRFKVLEQKELFCLADQKTKHSLKSSAATTVELTFHFSRKTSKQTKACQRVKHQDIWQILTIVAYERKDVSVNNVVSKQHSTITLCCRSLQIIVIRCEDTITVAFVTCEESSPHRAEAGGDVHGSCWL